MADLNDTPNYVDMFARAYQAGADQAKAKGVRNALSMAVTDPQGAQSALIQYGDFQGANALGQITAQQRALKTQQAVAPQIASGDYAGAAKTAAAGGAYDVASEIGKLDDQQRAHAAATADAVSKAAFGLAQLPQDQRAAGLQKIAPLLQQQGVTPDQIQQVDLSDQGLATIAHQAMSVKDQIASHQKDQELQNTAQHNRATEDLAKQTQAQNHAHQLVEEQQGAARIGIEQASAARAASQVLQDKDGTPYVYNTLAKSATTLDGKPYSPTGAQKLTSGAPRSATAIATQKFLQENPEATASDLAAFNASMGKQSAAAKAFATGKQGQAVNSLNVAVQHLDQLGQLADALGNGNVPLINKIGQAWTTQTGGPAPTNFNAAKQIVADEVVKAVVGSGGGVGDREQAAKAVQAAASPAQLKGVIQTYKGLMAGQLSGLRLQYKNSTGQDDFETHLSPTTQAELENHAKTGGGSAAGGVIQYDASGNRIK